MRFCLTNKRRAHVVKRWALKWAAALVVGHVLAAWAYLLVGCVPHSPINWPGVVQCEPGISDLVSTVSRILIGDGPEDQKTISARGKDALEELARTHAPGVVACVVERVVHDWTSPGAAPEPRRLAAAARGRSFLNAVGTDAQLPQDEP